MRLFKRGETWWGSFYSHDGERIRQSTRCHDRKAADAVVREWERAARDSNHAAQTATIQDAMTRFVAKRAEEAKAGRRSPATVEFYASKAGHLIRFFEYSTGERIPFLLSNLQPAGVDDYVSKRRTEGAGEHTISKELVTLRAALKHAKRSGLWHGDVTALLPIGFAPEYKPKTRALKPVELHALLGELTADRAARVAFIVATSANWGESEAATSADVAADLSTVRINGAKTKFRERIVPIVAEWQRSLLKHALDCVTEGGRSLFTKWLNVHPSKA